MLRKGVTLKGLGLILFMFVSFGALGQDFALQPPLAVTTDGVKPAMLQKQNRDFRLNWALSQNGGSYSLTGKNAKLKIGRSSNSYQLMELDVDGTSAAFQPNEIGLGPGRYYARITNSSATTASGIQADKAQNADIIYSNEILILIEADEAPAIIEPRGTITNSTPTFQWSAISGVPSYWLIVSSTPFDVVTDENDQISIEGATIVWQYITSDTDGTYGDINYSSPFTVDAPPLNPGEEYSYTVLNVYEENNPVFTSPVFGGIVPFIYNDPNAVPAADLVSPSNNEDFIAEETITFSWSRVPEATNYQINVLQLVKQQGVNVTVPIWSTTTTNTLIEYPAIDNLKSGKYQWNVIANNANGGGTTSESYFFTYEVPTGEFNAQIKSTVDNSVITGVELTARALTDGVTPVLPYFVQESSYSDSLVAGRYEFTAVKEGFETNSGEYTINEGSTTRFTILMEPLPSSIQGEVVDENGEVVGSALVTLESALTGEKETVTTDINGEFTSYLNADSYTIIAEKSGYISSNEESITLNQSEQKTLDSPLTIVNDQATISGFAYNDEGNPIERVKITITNGENSYEARTSGAGNYQFTVSSGDWVLSASKVGFVKPSDQPVSLSTGDIIQNQDFSLTGNANQITGFVRERVTREDGTTGTATFPNIKVTAIPNIGEPIVTTSEINGQYNLSLKSGSYTITAEEENYTSNNDQDLVIGIAIGETISGIDFELIPNPSSISGTVTLPDGNGVEGASVVITGVGSTTTSASGFYTLGVPEGSHQLSVQKTGLVSPSPKTASVSVGQDLTGVNFQMTPNAGTISGKITSGGQPLSGTKIIAVNSSNGNKSEITNNRDGTFSLNVRSGSWYVKAIKSGFISDSTSVLNVGPGQRLVNQDLALTENLALLRGTLTDGANPLRNATVTVTGSNQFNQSTVTQVNGTYAFTLPAGAAYTITAEKGGYRGSSKTTNTLIAGSTAIRDFELAANPSSISGTARVSGGQVLANAKIVAVNSSGVRTDSVRTKQDGKFILGLNPGTYSIISSKAGYSTKQTTTTLAIGQNLTGVNFDLNENFALFVGSITDNDGAGLDQVFVNLTKTDGGASASTDQEGSFTIARQTGGTFSIELSKTGYVSKTISRVVTDGQTVEINEQLLAKNGSISGSIIDENGEVIPDATVSVVDEEGTEYTAITDDTGDYLLDAVGLGSYLVNASKIGYTALDGVEVEVSLDNLSVTDVDVTDLIPNNGVIRGTITNSSTNAGIKEVGVSAVGDRGAGYILTSSSGAYELTNLIPDTYQLIFSKEGYKSDTTTVVIDPADPTTVSDLTLIQNNGVIRGAVKDPNGNALPFRVTVLASSDKLSTSTQTNEQGEFAFESMETGASYSISTDIYREGYDNAAKDIDVELGASETVIDGGLTIGISKAQISGNAGVGDATITLLNATTREIQNIQTSAQDGSYLFDFLSAGSYLVTASKLGYVFANASSSSDTSNSISVTFEQAVTSNFSATPNIGTLSVLVQSSGSGASNVDVTIVSADTSTVLTKKTDGTGTAVFADIEAGVEYTITPAKTGFSSNPVNTVLTVPVEQTVSTTFELTANSSALTGNVLNGTSGLGDADVTAILTSTGQTKAVKSAGNGSYTISGLAPGNYQVVATKSGFTSDTVSVTLSAGQTGTVDDLVVSRASIVVAGKVVFKGTGVQGVTVSAISSKTTETQTNSSGDFRFSALAIKTGATDTTLYQIKITTGIFTKTYQVEVTGEQIGQTIRIPETNLPSGQIFLTVTDGIAPLTGASLEFGISGGESERVVTGNDGAYTSEGTLRKATYVVSVSKSGLLVPQNTIKINLPSDTSTVNREVILPYQMLSGSEILADQATNVMVVNKSGYDNSRASGSLFYKKESDPSFTKAPMTITGDTLHATIPALLSTEQITYYTVVTDTTRNNSYTSTQRTKVPLASGILTSIRVTPSISGQRLRVGETYTLQLVVRDGINKSLTEEFAGSGSEGSVTWENLNDDGGVALENQNGTSIQFTPEVAGDYTLKVTASLDGSIVSRNLQLQATDIPIGSINVGSPGKQLDNSETHLFSYSAVDTSGGNVLLGSSLKWNVIPAGTGTIDSRGLLTPASSTLFGTFMVSVTDSISGVQGLSDQTELVAVIEPEEQYVLKNGLGLELTLPEGSVDIPSIVSLKETKPADTKKFVIAQGSDQSYTVGDRIYILSFSGSSLKKSASITLPEDTTISQLHSGDREIGRFNFTTLQWEILDGVAGKTFNGASGTVTTARLGQFAVMATNEPLGLKHAAVLPSPFSPDIAPLRIGYWLDTSFPPATVTIRVFNIRGELVRTLLENDLQQPGRYGSASGEKEILWDGLTDSGNMARNGRYVIQITAKDQQEEVVQLLQVVLIK